MPSASGIFACASLTRSPILLALTICALANAIDDAPLTIIAKCRGRVIPVPKTVRNVTLVLVPEGRGARDRLVICGMGTRRLGKAARARCSRKAACRAGD